MQERNCALKSVVKVLLRKKRGPVSITASFLKTIWTQDIENVRGLFVRDGVEMNVDRMSQNKIAGYEVKRMFEKGVRETLRKHSMRNGDHRIC